MPTLDILFSDLKSFLGLYFLVWSLGYVVCTWQNEFALFSKYILFVDRGMHVLAIGVGIVNAYCTRLVYSGVGSGPYATLSIMDHTVT